MSVANLIDDGGEPQSWSNLNVNSVKTKYFYISSGVASGSTNIYLNSTSGLDTNTGLTSGSPVLTLRKALEVALADALPSAELVINLAGSSDIDLGLDDSSLPDFQKQLDLSGLCAKFSVIKFYGVLANELSIGAGVATASAWVNFNRFARYTGAWSNPVAYDGLPAVAYTADKTKPSYRGLIRGALAGNTLDVAGPNDGMEAGPWLAATIAGPKLSTSNSLAVISKCPVVFERCHLESGASAHHQIVNLTPVPLGFYGCRIQNANTVGTFGYGQYYFEGCTLAGSGFELNTDKAQVVINNCNVYANLKQENEFSMNYCYASNAQIKCLSANANLDNTYCETGYNFTNHLLEISGSNVRCNNLKLDHYASDAAWQCLYAEDSIVSLDNARIERYQVSDFSGAADAIHLFNADLSLEGSDIVVLTGGVSRGRGIDAENSRVSLRGENGGIRRFNTYEANIRLDASELFVDDIATPGSDSFLSTNSNIVYIHNSKADFPETAPVLNSALVSFRLTGISQLAVEGAASYANAGGSSDLVQLGALAAAKTFTAGYSFYQSDAGFCQLDVRAI